MNINDKQKQIIIKTLRQSKGYDYEGAFNVCSKKEMNDEYGLTGKTRNQIVKEYKERVDSIDEIIKLVGSL